MAKKPTRRSAAADDEFDPLNLPAGAVPKGAGLSDEERFKLDTEAAEQAAAELKEREAALYSRAALVRARVAAGLLPAEAEDEQVKVSIDLPGDITGHIMLDGRLYFHGRSYDVPMKVARVLLDQCYRMHEHKREAQTGNRYAPYQQRRSPVLGRTHLGGPTR